MEMNDQNLISEEIEKKLKEIGVRAKTAAVDLSSLSTVTKNRVLCDAADLLIERTQDILKANAEDWKHAVEKQMPKGLRGVVTHIDDAAQVHVRWQNGSSLAIIPEVDKFIIVQN